ncbi:MAG TPA: proline dehydrogenase family protein [Vicinamibacterales bacterium]|nr:proline dehydrogenase family protein [Vicinamibacterales bacterium]
MRRALLAGSTSAWLRERASGAAFVRSSVSRFMPGETMDEALGAAEELKPEGISTILTRLGENITRVDEAEEVTQHYFQVLDKVAAAGLDAHVSVKPTQLGLDQDPALCRTNIDRLIERTEQRGNFLWLDMESSPYVDPTLDLYRYARAKSPKIGIAIQAYLYRTGQDVESLIPLGSAIRIVKGAYLESPDVAFPKKSDVDESFYTLCTRLLQPDAIEAGCLLHIATHDTVLLERLRGWIAEHRIPASAYEFAMLYGIQRGHQQRLAKEGERMRVLVSYGEYWFPWYMRRLAERPANVWFVLKNMFG